MPPEGQLCRIISAPNSSPVMDYTRAQLDLSAHPGPVSPLLYGLLHPCDPPPLTIKLMHLYFISGSASKDLFPLLFPHSPPGVAQNHLPDKLLILECLLDSVYFWGNPNLHCISQALFSLPHVGSHGAITICLPRTLICHQPGIYF